MKKTNIDLNLKVIGTISSALYRYASIKQEALDKIQNKRKLFWTTQRVYNSIKEVEQLKNDIDFIQQLQGMFDNEYDKEVYSKYHRRKK